MDWNGQCMNLIQIQIQQQQQKTVREKKHAYGNWGTLNVGWIFDDIR